MASRFNAKVALVTGSAGGIGRATAAAFAAAGARVIVTDLQTAAGQETVRQIRESGGEATFVQSNVAKADEVEALVAAAVQRYGRLDYAVNNAGIEGKFAGITDLPEQEWDRVLETNLKGTFLCLKYEARAMLAGGHGGAIVNVGSVNSFLGFPTGSAYVSSKHGQIGLTTSVSAELAPQGIRVNLVCPGFIDTPMHHRARGIVGDDLYDKGLIPRVHTRRAGRPEEIAQTIVFLCSAEASYISGTTLTPDGGFTMTI